MAPEQVRGRDRVDGRADVWALGVTLYEALTGSRPFGAVDARAPGRDPRPRAEPAEPARGRAATRARTVVLGKALEKDPLRRYATAAAFADDSRGWRGASRSRRGVRGRGCGCRAGRSATGRGGAARDRRDRAGRDHVPVREPRRLEARLRARCRSCRGSRSCARTRSGSSALARARRRDARVARAPSRSSAALPTVEAALASCATARGRRIASCARPLLVVKRDSRSCAGPGRRMPRVRDEPRGLRPSASGRSAPAAGRWTLAAAEVLAEPRTAGSCWRRSRLVPARRGPCEPAAGVSGTCARVGARARRGRAHAG
jgi:hypothetical protein